MKYKIIGIVLGVFCFNAHAAFYDGNKLKQLVEAYDRTDRNPNASSEDYSNTTMLLGYVGGVFDSLGFLVTCKPANLKMGQVTSIVVNYVRAHPERWGEDASTLVIEALNEAFKCPIKK